MENALCHVDERFSPRSISILPVRDPSVAENRSLRVTRLEIFLKHYSRYFIVSSSAWQDARMMKQC
jgi:hypothetical protein